MKSTYGVYERVNTCLFS